MFQSSKKLYKLKLLGIPQEKRLEAFVVAFSDAICRCECVTLQICVIYNWHVDIILMGDSNPSFCNGPVTDLHYLTSICDRESKAFKSSEGIAITVPFSFLTSIQVALGKAGSST